VAVGDDNVFVVVWQDNATEASQPVLISARRKATDTDWFLAAAVAGSVDLNTSAPLIGPNGDVTLVWTEIAGGRVLRTSTYTTATDTWSPATTLSSYPVSEEFDAEIGSDGTLVAGWAHLGNGDWLFGTATRVNGSWTERLRLSREGSSYPEGVVAVGPDGNATAVWLEEASPGGHQLRTAGTGLTAEPPKAAVRRDYVNADGLVDLFAQKATGELTLYRGHPSGVFSGTTPGGTWPASSLLVPFDDMNKDGTNDVLVRSANGVLRAYQPVSGTVADPAGPEVSHGGGWNIYDALATPGDMTGDGRNDLLARESATGNLYVYEQGDTGTFYPRVKIGRGWKPYTIIGAGDLNGDRFGDLITKDAAGDLWRYEGDDYYEGDHLPRFLPRVKMGTGWGIYDAILAVGDLTGDGKGDLVARDAAGVLWRYDGDGAGGLFNRVKIGNGGWQAFKTLS
jgi:hypothetical protein